MVVAVDPGKVMNRVWVSNGAGLLEEPVEEQASTLGASAVEAEGVLVEVVGQLLDLDAVVQGADEPAFEQ